MMSLDGEGVMEVPVPVTAMAETGKIPEGFSVGMPYSICTLSHHDGCIGLGPGP